MLKNLVLEPVSKGPNTFRKRKYFKSNMHLLNKYLLNILSSVLVQMIYVLVL